MRHPFTEIIFAKCLKIRICYFIGTHFVKVRKWGVKVDGKVIVPPLYHSIAQPVGAYCAFEQVPRHWGVMTLKGKVIVDAKYEKVEIHDNGIAMVTNITGKTQTINLK